MAKTPSNMLDLGTKAPTFNLPDTDGRLVSMDQFQDKKALVVMFICNHCPFVMHVADELAKIGRDYEGQSFAMVAINSNDVERYPDDRPELMKVEKEQRGYNFPYLFDESQEVAKAYQAACTPDFYLFDSDRRLVYRGQLDDSRPGNQIPVTGTDLRHAIDAVLAAKPVSLEQKASIGCNIKWKS